MLTELPRPEKMRTLEQFPYCFHHADSQSTQLGVVLDVDHVFTQQAGRQNRRILPRDFIKSHENQTHVCKPCHREIDSGLKGKVQVYRTFGLSGLVEYNAVYYPIPKDPTLQEVMYYQWRVLFMRLRDNLRALKGDFPPHKMADYSQALKLAEFHLEQWEIGPEKFLGRNRSSRGLIYSV